ncbi:hypothetical protein VRB95_10985 [Erwinia aphidicola]|uniref:hypothetical protein n=1 Tax=Erwinia aphidicola TaxID=68334 RepID=UPI0030CBECAA
MTVASEINHNQYVGNGVTTSFDYGFRIFKNSHLLVQVSDLDGVITTLVLGTDYMVSGVGASGGKVVLTAPLSTGWAISIDRNLPIVQETDLRNQGTFYAETHEDAFDYLTMLIQRVYSYFTLALRKPSWLAKFYDAQGNRISNLSDPVKPQDAVTKNYSDSQAQANLGKTLRVPDSFIAPLPSIASMEGTVIGIVNGRPVGVPVPSGSAADVLIQLAKPSGAGLIGNGNDTVNNFLYHTPEEFNSGNMDTALAASLAASASDGRRTWVKGTKTLTVTATIPAGSVLQNDGVIQSFAATTALTMSTSSKIIGGEINTSIPGSAVRAWNNSNDVSVRDLKSIGSVKSDTSAAYAVSAYQSFDFRLSNAKLGGYSGGVELSKTTRAMIDGLKTEKMWYHSSLVAGGYGVLMQAAADSIINNFNYLSGNENTSSGYTGRHAIYQSVWRQGGLTGSTNTIVNNVIANYRDKTVDTAGAINIRMNDRGIWSNVIIDGSHVSGTPEDGDITSNIFSHGIIRTRKFTNGVTKYGFSWGATANGFSAVGCITSNSIVSVRPESGVESIGCYGYEITGRNHLVGNMIIDVPPESTPFIVRSTVNNIIISDILDPVFAGTAPFILFEGGTNISLRGIKTSRPLFGSIGNVTNLTVDFSRTSSISINSGNVTTSDNNALFGLISVGANNIVVNFRQHVTQSAVDNAIAMIGKTASPNIPIITSRTAKGLIIEFYTIGGGLLVNPQTTQINFSITINS